LIRPADIADVRLKSGYRHVRFENVAGRPKPYVAEVRNPQRGKGRGSMSQVGPHRATALEAAWDYCNHVNNGGQVPTAKVLKSAGHKYTKAPVDPQVQAALGVLRDARAQRQGKQGYVYLIVEDLPGGGLRYGKVGYSVNPPKRVAELQTGNPRKLKLHLMKPGTVADEAALHAKYQKYNVLQEWFLITKELLLEWDAEHQVNLPAA